MRAAQDSAMAELVIAQVLGAPRANRRPWVSPTPDCRAMSGRHNPFGTSRGVAARAPAAARHHHRHPVCSTPPARTRRRLVGKPFLHLIGNLLWVAAKHRMLLDCASAGDSDEITHCRVPFTGMPDHAVAKSLTR